MKLYIRQILIFIFILASGVIYGQSKEDYTRIYEELKAKGYNIDKDKAKALLKDEDAFSASDSISKIMLLLDKERTKFKTMEEAEMEVENLLNKVSKDRNTFQRRNGGLAVRIGENTIIKNKERDRIAHDAWTDLVKSKDTTTQDFLDYYGRFDNRPTYYVNDIEVTQSVLNRIRESEVQKREYRVKNTLSGNPNGEIWYTITDRAAKRIGLSENSNEQPRDINSTQESKPENPATNEKKLEEKPTKSTLKDKNKDTKTNKSKRSVRAIKESRKSEK